jgi:tetratricopeptide (TPR) repeat protein
MPRPCPKCARVVPDARESCIYCGALAPRPESEDTVVTNSASLADKAIAANEPATLDSVDAVVALIAAAHTAQQRGALDETACMVSRIFRDLGGDQREQLLALIADAWLHAVEEVLVPADLARTREYLKRGIAAASDERLLDASRCFSEARVIVGADRRVGPALEMLALGAMQAAALAAEDAEREATVGNLIERASTLLATPETTAEGLGLLHEALALVPDPPRSELDRVRAERLRTAIEQCNEVVSETVEEVGDVEEVGEAEEVPMLPPPGALSHDAWNALGERTLASDPKGALVCFERAIAGESTVAAYWLNAARALLALGSPLTSVIDAYEKAAHLDPDELRALVGVAGARQQAGLYEAAAEAWDEVLCRHPEAAVAAQHREFCQRAAELRAEGTAWDAVAWVARGQLLADAQEWQLADACFAWALEKAPRNGAALAERGIALCHWAFATQAESEDAAMARLQQSASCLQEALEVDPSNEIARSVLELCNAALATKG